jgi:hypothetical protein
MPQNRMERRRRWDNVLDLSSDELEHYKHDSHELRAIYVASLIYSLGGALSRGLTKLGDLAAASWLKNSRQRWADPRINRQGVYLPQRRRGL